MVQGRSRCPQVAALCVGVRRAVSAVSAAPGLPTRCDRRRDELPPPPSNQILSLALVCAKGTPKKQRTSVVDSAYQRRPLTPRAWLRPKLPFRSSQRKRGHGETLAGMEGPSFSRRYRCGPAG
ncbi:hypothetical protein MRX96_021869 [Rhipicephalus microplus]